MPATKLTKASIAHAHATATQTGRPIPIVTMDPKGSIRIDFFLPDRTHAGMAIPCPVQTGRITPPVHYP